jgi:hypothetical protein
MSKRMQASSGEEHPEATHVIIRKLRLLKPLLKK